MMLGFTTISATDISSNSTSDISSDSVSSIDSIVVNVEATVSTTNEIEDKAIDYSTNTKSIKKDDDTNVEDKKTYYVSTDGKSTNDGLTPETAYDYNSVFRTFEQKMSKFNNTNIVVQEGTYNVTSFIYAYYEYCPNFKVNIMGNGTVIFNGQTNSSIFFAVGGPGYGSNSNDITIQNIIFTNGTGYYTSNWLFGSYCYGGAVYNRNGNMTLINCTFINNNAKTANYVLGGAVCVNGGNLTIINSSFINNTVSGARSYGGAVATYGSTSITHIINSTFIGNKANATNTLDDPYTNVKLEFAFGGAVGTYSSGSTYINDSYFENNTAGSGGAVGNVDAKTTVINNTFINNNATNGGAVGGTKISSWGTATTNVTDNTMINNTAYNGAGVAIMAGSGYVINNTMTNNNATNGGAIANENGTTEITDNTLVNNTAFYGGAVASQFGLTNITNNTVIGNNATNGGAIANDKSNVTITNNTISNNNATAGAAIYTLSGNTTINTNNISSSNGVTSVIYNNGSTILNDNFVFNNTVSDENSYVVYNENTATINVTENKFYNNTDFKRDMLFNDFVSENVNNNTYISNYLETSTSTVLENVTMYVGNYNTTITIDIRDVYNDTVRNGAFKVYINDVEYNDYEVINGSTLITISTRNLSDVNNLVFAYTSKDLSYQPLNLTTTITLVKYGTITTVSPVKGIIGENITLIATVTDENGNLVNGGNLVFKLNGKTLRVDGSFNSTADPLKFNVVNGTVTYTLTADLYLRNAKNLSASYSGSRIYESSKSDITTAEIAKRNAEITVTTVETTKQDVDIEFVATLTDVTPHGTNTTAINDEGYVVFKINGVSLKDTAGEVIRVKVENNTAKYTYHVPVGMSSDDGKGNIRNYTVDVVYQNDIFYPDSRNSTVFHVEKSPINIQFTNVTINNSTKTITKITGNITDYKGNLLKGVNKVCVKVNNGTIRDANNNTIFFNVVNGIIDLSNIDASKFKTFDEIMIVSGDRQAYLEGRNTTSDLTIIN